MLEEIEKGVFAAYLGLKRPNLDNPELFIKDVRNSSRDATVQAFEANYCAGLDHLRAILRESWMARKRGASYARKLELDLLLRLSCNLQIDAAIHEVGLKRVTKEACIVGIGTRKSLEKIAKFVSQLGLLSEEVLSRDPARERFLIKKFKIKKNSLRSTVPVRGDRLGLLLAEKAALLGSKH